MVVKSVFTFISGVSKSSLILFFILFKAIMECDEIHIHIHSFGLCKSDHQAKKLRMSR